MTQTGALREGRTRNRTHPCPGCERPQVPDRLFACGRCWHRLPRALQRRICATAGSRGRGRTEARDAARAFYATGGPR